MFFLNQHKQEDVSNYAKHIISGICNYLKNTEYELIVKPIFRYDNIEAVKEVVERKLADGIILTHTSLNDERVKYLSEKNFPFVTIFFMREQFFLWGMVFIRGKQKMLGLCSSW